MIDRLSHVTFNRADVPPAEAASLTLDRVRTLLRQIGATPEDVAVLVTCERVELYHRGSTATWRDTARRVARLIGTDRHEVGTGRETVRHLVRVAAGLQSRIPGECHILGQVRRASRTGGLHRLFDAAVGIGRRVRRRTGIGVTGHGYVDAAIQRAHADGSAETVAIVGGGRLARDLYRGLRAEHIEPLVIVRRPERVADWALPTGVRTLDELRATLATVDVVMTATSSIRPVITPDLLPPILPRLIDLGQPPNVDPTIAAVRLDDLAADAAPPRLVIAAAEAVVETELERLLAWWHVAERRAV